MQLLKYTCLILFAGVIACTKKDDTKLSTEVENRLAFVIDDNKFNFSFFNTAMGRTAYRNELLNDGPFTVLIPDNNAFIKAGYANDQAVLKESGVILNNMVAYHIVHGTWKLNEMPFKFNQELSAISGSKIYVTRWIKNADTVVTINGTPVLAFNLNASNGLIQVIDNVLQPLVYSKIGEVISSDTTLNYLNVALQQAGLKEEFYKNEVNTFFAPSNNAFRKAGFQTIDSISRTDANVLKSLLQYHFFQGRRFIYDYILTTGTTERTTQTMFNNNTVKISLVKSGTKYTSITLAGEGNANPAQVIKSNVMAGNGVVHIIDQILNENQK
ncbi:fasciclin domain-containing protein [Chitinophaga silvatica]|uniref:Fasciclin domain-containing protein n=1 Tax=Chitinophaga silvatica TaxID=2282649 RepID=A0A3E1YGZ6_9BACT|nr:fasciclin domain-containing protein [Chitinophaga silvatica]RFS26659.1 fasciclin domain-containing protein [Chitinophaga silvatica]